MSKSKSGKKFVSDIGLHMECIEEELDPAQISFYKQAECELSELQAKIDMFIKKMNAEVIEKGENCMALQMNVTPSISRPPATTNIITRSGAAGSTSPGGTFLLMDSRLGLVVSQSSTTAATVQPGSVSAKPNQVVSPPIPATRTRSSGRVNKSPAVVTQSTTRSRTVTQTPEPPQTGFKVKLSNSSKQPTEGNVRGGLTTGKTQSKQLQDESSKGSGPDSKEVTFNKLSGKTFPSLVVIARPHLKLKDIPQASVNQERSALDAKVKSVLMYTQTKFTEWLIQQGLIRSEQICQVHCNNNGTPVKLKLGMYSDVSRFPHSGGYVWISECCPSQFVSVYSGSIFEGAPHPPSTLLKLIYHWACQTNVQNVVQWVKVDNWYVKNFFTNMRAVCTQAVQEKYHKLGGSKKKVEVGVISLGTTSQDGHMRQVKVEVLGVMDPESKTIRLRAVEPLPGEKNVKRKFVKILEPLAEWVHKESTILTDYTVDKGTLKNMGFDYVYQVSATSQPSKYSNENIMEYLRRIVPRMFQNTLSLLSRQIIQQFLDELVWRELWGPTASQAFENIVVHLAEQTKLDVTDSLLYRLSAISSNPFKVWKFNSTTPAVASSLAASPAIKPQPDTSGSRSRKRLQESATVTEVPKKMVKTNAKKEDKIVKSIPDDVVAYYKTAPRIPINSYYYGSINGDSTLINAEYKGQFRMRCPVCNKKFNDAVILMKHILLHCQQEPFVITDVNKAHQCCYCLIGFNSSSLLKNHMEEVHFTKSKNSQICVICEEKFQERTDLYYHMHVHHTELELPYECGVCHYRTSAYKALITHFTEVHHGGENIMCPFCLKVVALCYKGVPIEGNAHFFVAHVEKHYIKSVIHKCDRCCLSFVNTGIWEQHVEADHCSFKDDKEVKPFSSSAESIMIPEPTSLVKPLPGARPVNKSNRHKGHQFTFRSAHVDLMNVNRSGCCVECEANIKPGHFNGSYNCSKCQYATFCERAMNEHSNVFHSSKQHHYNIGRPVVLTAVLYCPCGFSSMSGNRLAKHLAQCDWKTAYTSQQTAKAALDRLQNGDPQNMLNMLGLIRKPSDSSEAKRFDLKTEKTEEVVSMAGDH